MSRTLEYMLVGLLNIKGFYIGIRVMTSNFMVKILATKLTMTDKSLPFQFIFIFLSLNPSLLVLMFFV